MKRRFVSCIMLASCFCLVSFIVPKGWQVSGGSEKKYEMGSWKAWGHDSSRSCGVIRAIKQVYDPGEHGSLIQKVSSQRYLGKRIRLSGYMKSRGAEKAGFMVRVDRDDEKKPLAFDNMNDRPVKGTTDWTLYTIDIDVPYNAAKITFGAKLSGLGQIWFDDLSIEVIGNSTISADYVMCDTSISRVPLNMNFEQ